MDELIDVSLDQSIQLEEKLNIDLNELDTLHDGKIDTVLKEEENEINVVKSKYSEIRLKIIEEKKLKQENVRANIAIWSRRK